MTDCGCDKAKAELEEYLHNELAKQDAADVAEHMASCEDCTEEHMVGLALTLKVRRDCRETAPEDLMLAIKQRLANA